MIVIPQDTEVAMEVADITVDKHKRENYRYNKMIWSWFKNWLLFYINSGKGVL